VTEESVTVDIGISGRPADALREQYGSLADLVHGYKSGDMFSKIDGIGQKTSSKIHEFMRNNFPSAERFRHEHEKAYCTEYTLDVEPPRDATDDETYFGYVCPACDLVNKLRGEPRAFRGKPFECRRCGWICQLWKKTLDEFIEEHDL